MSEKGLQQWFDTWRGPIGYDTADLDITCSGELAFARCLNRISGEKVDGKKESVWVRSTVCFHHVAGAWKVMHVHSSVPFYMDGSLKAAVDLNP